MIYSFGHEKSMYIYGELYYKDKSKFNEIETNLNKNYNYPLFFIN